MAVASIVTAGVGLAIAGYGAYQKAHAASLAKKNLANRPVYKPLQEDDSELNLAEAQANQGIGASAQQQLQNNTDRNLSTTTNAALMGGADANTIGNIADSTQNAYNASGIYNDQVRQQHIGTLLNAYSAYNAQRNGNADKSFQFNKYAPWADQQQLYSNQIAGGQQTMNSGVNLFAKGAAGAAGAKPGDPNTNQTTPATYGTGVYDGGDNAGGVATINVPQVTGLSTGVSPWSSDGGMGGAVGLPSSTPQMPSIGMTPYYTNLPSSSGG